MTRLQGHPFSYSHAVGADNKVASELLAGLGVDDTVLTVARGNFTRHVNGCRFPWEGVRDGQGFQGIVQVDSEVIRQPTPEQARIIWPYRWKSNRSAPYSLVVKGTEPHEIQ